MLNNKNKATISLILLAMCGVLFSTIILFQLQTLKDLNNKKDNNKINVQAEQKSIVKSANIIINYNITENEKQVIYNYSIQNNNLPLTGIEFASAFDSKLLVNPIIKSNTDKIQIISNSVNISKNLGSIYGLSFDILSTEKTGINNNLTSFFSITFQKQKKFDVKYSSQEVFIIFNTYNENNLSIEFNKVYAYLKDQNKITKSIYKDTSYIVRTQVIPDIFK